MQGDISESYQTRDATLAPVADCESIDGRTVHRQTLDVQELPREVAPGVNLNAWTFNGSYMGPTLRGRVGDIFEITLINNGSMGHSVDFHAGTVSPEGFAAGRQHRAGAACRVECITLGRVRQVST
ncbi:multicopper oxidase domain-containing protein [Rothia nasimurium]|uniref:multicopper oxidase domain-containing protein n=1 Tax=Rothia nasimurium TaxID=85336 RepID=UPI00143155A9|nr:multicopper oxidase domain-containing protein [Rothia nasimurium]MBF0809055.1 multicopper oxidase domain-containing protein [Rothia nasimurium]